MMADDLDPILRWRQVADWYADFAAHRSWGHLAPMVELATWIGTRPDAEALFPSTSLEHLLIRCRPGYEPDLPTLGCVVNHHRQFACGLSWQRGQRGTRREVLLVQARATLVEFIGWLGQADAIQRAIRRDSTPACVGSSRPA